MRRQMIAALDFPRDLILNLVEEHDCPRGQLFEPGNALCIECQLNRQCHWVTILNDYSDFTGKPAYTINASLRYGVQLVEEFSGGQQHEIMTCACEACSWLRDARALIVGFEETLPANPFRPVH